ncbi:MAG: FAD binding domain-containing protein [Rubrivivax sp.]|nr:FAD binding domain-containing protein [Rubrivivax sp.]
MNATPDFLLRRPATLAEATAALAEPGAQALGGGTDLLPNLRRGMLRPRTLVDLSGLPTLAAVEREAGHWRFGAGVTLAALARDRTLAASLPALAQAAAHVAGPGHRSAATLGGNLCQDTRCVHYNQSAWWRAAQGGCLKLDGSVCHVAPQGKRCHAAYQGDLAAALLALDAELEIASAGATRRCALPALYRDDGAAHLTLAAGEWITAVRVPQPAPRTRSGFVKVSERAAMDFPLAGVAVALRLDGNALVALAVGISGTGSCPLRLQETAPLLGRAVDDDLLAALGKLVARQVSPMRSTVTVSNHRRLVAVVTAQRLVRELAEGCTK